MSKKRIEESDSEEQNLDGYENTEYNVEASDDEVDEAPSKWYDEFPYEKFPRQEIDRNDVEALRNEATEMVLQEPRKSWEEISVHRRSGNYNGAILDEFVATE